MASVVLIMLVLADGYRAYITPVPADELANFFEDVAFGTDDGQNTEYVARWQDALRIYIAGDPDAAQRKELKLALETLSRLSGLSMTFDQGNMANYTVHFIKHDDLEDVANSYQPGFLSPTEPSQNVQCGGASWHNASDAEHYEYNRAIQLISTDLPQDNFFGAYIEMLVSGLPYKWNLSCLREELMQSLGLQKDSDLASPSVVNDNANHAIYSINDTILIRTLYDPRIQAGMPKAQAMEIVRETIIPELISAYKIHGEEALYQK